MVYFVGAGPGAVDLITIRGKALLEKADVIIYAGSLVNEELLKYAKKDCEIHNSALMSLPEVMEVIIKNKEKEIVRLHTGDASIFGAIKEQMAGLEENKIEYEVCPGVSSFLAAAASMKAEYTLPGVSQSVIITRMQGRTPVPDGESIKAFSAHQTSMVIFLSAGLTKKLVTELIEGGYPPNTPAAIIYKASWEQEQIFYTTVSQIDEVCEKNNIKNTALIAVGRFLNGEHLKSLLYDPSFETGFRKAKK